MVSNDFVSYDVGLMWKEWLEILHSSFFSYYLVIVFFFLFRKYRLIDCQNTFFLQPCGEVQIIQEDLPLRTPRDAMGDLAPFGSGQYQTPSKASLGSTLEKIRDLGDESVANSDGSFERSLSLAERKIHESAVRSFHKSDTSDESTSTDDERSEVQLEEDHHDSDSFHSLNSEPENEDSTTESHKGKHMTYWRNRNINHLRRVSRTFLPYWVYRMYDSYCLAQRAAGT